MKLRVIPFKKGPDYIDAGWLAMATQHPCYNLDPFLMSPNEILSSFVYRSSGGDVSVIEGNRGLYDGVDVEGSCSSAELAKLLRCPVVLVLDATKVTRTAAALVLGCQQLDPDVEIAGVILNQVAGKRHEKVLKGAIEQYCRIPILGVVPRERGNFFPERHMGLIPPQEHNHIQEAVEFAADKMHECLDLESLWQIAQKTKPLGCPMTALTRSRETGNSVVIGIIRDAAFQFYYPENLETLEEEGAVLKEISSFDDSPLPHVDALYIGGGFPETHLEILAENKIFRESLRQNIEAGLPVYAECGGLMFLCRSIRYQGASFPMVGIFPYDVVMETKPQGHGYTLLECTESNPYFAEGTMLKGHEFHYSRIVGYDSFIPLVFRLRKGYGIMDGRDGFLYRNALACYSHIHAIGNKGWAEAMVRSARCFCRERLNGAYDPGSDLKQNGLVGVHGYAKSL
jgi:cobyrinic acid a,c-diamide synthase